MAINVTTDVSLDEAKTVTFYCKICKEMVGIEPPKTHELLEKERLKFCGKHDH